MTGIEAALTGTLGRDPELKRVKAATLAMLTLAVAVDDGARGESRATTWVRVVLFGERAEALAPTLAKGAKVYCEGHLTLDRWTGQDGAERSGLSMVAGLVQPLGQIGRRRPQAAPKRRTRHAATTTEAGQGDSGAPFDDPIGL